MGRPSGLRIELRDEYRLAVDDASETDPANSAPADIWEKDEEISCRFSNKTAQQCAILNADN